MKKVNYDSETGKILGYYEIDVNYSFQTENVDENGVPLPIIEITDNEQSTILNETREGEWLVDTASESLIFVAKSQLEKDIEAKKREISKWEVELVKRRNYYEAMKFVNNATQEDLDAVQSEGQSIMDYIRTLRTELEDLEAQL